MMTVVWVSLGSALGGVARYFVMLQLASVSSGFPWGTLGVNLVGSFALGLVSGGLVHLSSAHAEAVRAFAVVGFCGGFTTFSTFSAETFRFLEGARYGLAALYVGVSVVAGLLCAALGYLLSR